MVADPNHVSVLRPSHPRTVDGLYPADLSGTRPIYTWLGKCCGRVERTRWCGGFKVPNGPSMTARATWMQFSPAIPVPRRSPPISYGLARSCLGWDLTYHSTYIPTVSAPFWTPC